jgi:hypothetical protein
MTIFVGAVSEKQTHLFSIMGTQKFHNSFDFTATTVIDELEALRLFDRQQSKTCYKVLKK